MSITYSVDSRSGHLMTRADGVVTFREIDEHLDVEQRNRDLHRPELIDARGATTDVTALQVRLLIQRAASMLRAADVGPTAIVTSNDVVYGMARMYSILAEGAGVHAEVFRDMSSANMWLEQFETGSV
jgi:hypothetical protein